jgi:plastocyanin
MRLTTKTPAVAALAALLAACSPSSEPSGDVAAGPADGDAVEIVADDTFFEPKPLRLAAGEEVTVEVTNEGDTPHDLAIEELDLNTGTIQPGETKTATFEVPEGSTKLICTFHGGMETTIEAS